MTHRRRCRRGGGASWLEGGSGGEGQGEIEMYKLLVGSTGQTSLLAGAASTSATGILPVR